MQIKKFIKPLCTLLGFVAFLVAMKVLPFQEWLQPVFDFIENSGAWGPVYFVGISVVLVILFVPVSVLVTASGLLFGFWMGFVVISFTLMLGIIIGFVGGKGLWPKVKDASMFQRDIFQAVRKAVEKEGHYLIALLRMTPFFHFMTGNLFFGSLDIKTVPYLLFSYLGMIPGTLLLVYAGSLANNSLSDDGGMSLPQIAFFAVGLLVFSGISYRVTKVTKQILHKEDA